MVKKQIAKKPAGKAQTGGINNVLSKYDQWITWLTCAILVAVPIIFSRISYDQFDLVKLAVFRVLVLGIVLFWAAKMLTKPEPIKWSWREGLLAAFLLFAIISAFSSIHIPTALHGKYKRYEGLLTFITYLTAYFVIIQTPKDKSRLQVLVEIISITGGIVALYGVMQYLGLDPIYWGDVPFEQRRSFSTFGNPDLLAGYLVLAFPCAIISFFNKTKASWVHGMSAFFLAVGLLTALTRGGWVGAAASTVCLAVLMGRRLKLYWKKISIVIAPVVMVLIALVIYSSVANLNIVSKFEGMFQLNSGTAMSRFQIWKAGWLMVKDRPFFGQGLDTYRLASEHFETQAYVRSVGGTTVSDNAHNYFVHLAAGGGPAAAILLYGFFIAWIIRMIRVRRKLADDTERLLLSGIIAAAVGYLASMLTGISIVGATSTFWVLMAAGTAFTWNIDPGYRLFDVVKRSKEIVLVAVLAVVTVTVIGAGFAVSMYAGDVYLVNGLVAGAGGQVQLAESNLNTAFSLYPGNGRIMSEMGQMYSRWAGAAAQQKDQKSFSYFAQKAIESFKRANASEPLEIDYRVFLANSYGYTGQRQEALDILSKVIEQRPYSVPGNLLYGQFIAKDGKKAESVKYFETVLSVAPSQQSALSSLIAYYKEIGDSAKADFYQKELNKVNAASR